MEISSRLERLKEFLEVNVCSKMKLKAETKTREYELVNPKCYVFAPRDMQSENINYPFISIEFDEIVENKKEEIYSIQLYAFVFDSGLNILKDDGSRSYHPNRGQGFVTLFNFLSKIRRELIVNRDISALIGSEITIRLVEEIAPPYFGGVISFKMITTPYPNQAEEIQEFFKL